MRTPPKGAHSGTPDIHLLLGYVADLELEVDRLRKQAHFLRDEVRDALKRVEKLCANGAEEPAARLAGISRAVAELASVLRDMQEPPGYHPAHDQVVAIAIRPLLEQVFRWQQRLEGAPEAALRLELEIEYVEWFPARLRHIFDNLISNSLKYRDPAKAEAWVTVGLRAGPESYELRVTDNGVGLPPGEPHHVLELYSRAAAVRAAIPGVGLPVVKLLVEQSGGSFTVDSGEGQGTTFLAVLPRYGVDDYLT